MVKGRANIIITIKNEAIYGLSIDMSHLTLTHYKGQAQNQGHAHLDCEYIIEYIMEIARLFKNNVITNQKIHGHFTRLHNDIYQLICKINEPLVLHQLFHVKYGTPFQLTRDIAKY